MNFLNKQSMDLKQGAIRAMFDRAVGMTDVISLGIGEPDMATPTEICRAAAEALDRGITHYTPNAGFLSLRRAVAETAALREIGYNPNTEIIIGNGGMGLLSLLMATIINPGDEVLVQDPQWLNYIGQIRHYGGVPVRVPTDASHNFEMQPEVIESLITEKTKALMVNSPNNPTGHVISRGTLEKIAEIARRRDLLVISDEVYSTLLYDDARHCTIASLPGMKERTVVINSFSKAYAMTGWRLGYAAGPKEIIARMTRNQENFNACANAPGQQAALTALAHPELTEKLRQIFARRRQILLEGLSSIDGFSCEAPKGAFYLFPDISAFGLSDETFCDRLLEEEHVVCIPGSAFGACGAGHIRMAYTTGETDLYTAIERIRTFCRRLRQETP